MLEIERSFILKKTFYDLKASASKTYAGFLWHILSPTVYVLIFYVAFNSGFTGRPSAFFSFVVIGVVVYRFVILSLSEALTVIENNLWLLKFYDFPKILLFISRYLFAFVNFLFFAVVALFIFFLVNSFYLENLFLLLLIIFLNIILVFSLFIIFACLSPIIKDISVVWEVISMAILFCSGVFVDINKMPEFIQNILWINPIAIFIDFYRRLLLYNTDLPTFYLNYLILITLFLSIVAYFVYKKLNKLYLKITW